jgi:hypothetical protein
MEPNCPRPVATDISYPPPDGHGDALIREDRLYGGWRTGKQVFKPLMGEFPCLPAEGSAQFVPWWDARRALHLPPRAPYDNAAKV